MIVLIKLIFAHFIGDFMLQPKSWVAEKEIHKAKSLKLYIHIFIHGILVLLVVWDFSHWLLAVLIMAAHGTIDTIKLYAQIAAQLITQKLNRKKKWKLAIVFDWFRLSAYDRTSPAYPMIPWGADVHYAIPGF